MLTSFLRTATVIAATFAAYAAPVFAQADGAGSDLADGLGADGLGADGLGADGVGVEQKLGAQVPLSAEFQTCAGQFVTLEDVFGETPVLLTLNYIDCPSLCSQQLSSLAQTMAAMKLELGVDFRVVTISIHPDDKLEDLTAQKERFVTEYRGILQDAGRDVPKDVALAGWTMMRGTRDNIDMVAEAVGFGYRWIPAKGEYDHAAPTIVCSPEGIVTRYQQGVGFPGPMAMTLRRMLVEASEGKVGAPLEGLFLRCFFDYDDASGTYKLAYGMLRGGAVLAILAIITGIFFMRRTEVQQDAVVASAASAHGERDVS